MFQQDVMATRRHRVGRVAAHSRLPAGVAGGHFATRQPADCRLGEAWPIEAQHLSILPISHVCPGSDHYKAAFSFQIPTHISLTESYITISIVETSHIVASNNWSIHTNK